MHNLPRELDPMIYEFRWACIITRGREVTLVHREESRRFHNYKSATYQVIPLINVTQTSPPLFFFLPRSLLCYASLSKSESTVNYTFKAKLFQRRKISRPGFRVNSKESRRSNFLPVGGRDPDRPRLFTSPNQRRWKTRIRMCVCVIN